jgi:hypothetical protein
VSYISGIQTVFRGNPGLRKDISFAMEMVYKYIIIIIITTQQSV